MMTQELVILLIEDAKSFVIAATAMIESCPLIPGIACRVVSASTLEAALQLLAKARVDLILLDLTLPDSCGLETLAAVKQSAPFTPIVVLSGIDDVGMAISALQNGAQDFLLKGAIDQRQFNRALLFALERVRLHALETERIRLYEQREDFMATLVHDLKNPLIGANRLLELITGGQIGSVSDDVRELLIKLSDSNAALLTMVKTMVEVYRYEKDAEALTKEHTNLDELVQKYLQEIEPIVRVRGVPICTQLCGDRRLVFVDRAAILRVVQNLIDNAVKFSPIGAPVHLRLKADPDSAIVEVSDQGPGIAKEDVERLFQRFWQGRSRQAHTGTGLGLYLCRQIVEAHGGKIWCDSSAHEGATFLFSLPLLDTVQLPCEGMEALT